ncbi:MAG: hypothetical protein B7Z77_05750 [Acidocella sp. 20-58-15]|nr:MAG: hypothetical protein B7Z77_05750 [Acidocella sp. 20-58-15]
MHRYNFDNLSLIDTPDKLERVAALTATLAPHKLPLVRAAQRGIVNIIEPNRGAVIPKRMLEDTRRPNIILLGDDDYASTGPDGWACARRLRYWGKSAIIHAAGAEEVHYNAALAQALLVRRFVFIECDEAHRESWKRFFIRQMPILIIKAEDGLHPMHPAKGEAH